jgi:hypothetical protein
MTTPEGRVKKLTNEVLDGMGCYRFMPVQRGFGPAGLDYFCCYNGRFFAVETKTAKKKLSPRQVVTAKVIAAARGTVFVVRNIADLAWMQDVLSAGTNYGIIYDMLGSEELYGEFWCS